MKSSMKDQAECTCHKAIDKVKEEAGNISDKPKSETEGKGEKTPCKVHAKTG